MLNYNLLAIYFFFAVYSFTNGDNELGDSCISTSGNKGTCELLSKCQSARDHLKRGNFPRLCGFKNSEIIACCPREVGDISKKKCAEYSTYVSNQSENSQKVCDPNFIPLIIDGEETAESEFPHMAAIGVDDPNDGQQWFCGGSLISSQYVLTAAHCFYHQQRGQPTHVQLGATILNKTDHRQIIGISKLLAHPDYHSPQLYHDVGLIKLEKLAVLNRHVRPACLIKNRFTGDKAIATGWGQTENSEYSDKLLKVTLKLVDLQTCNETYKPYTSRKIINGIGSTNLCAKSDDKSKAKDTCQGDSGGPLQVYHKEDKVKCMYDVIAITSYGQNCGGIAPGVYVRVSDYLGWIEETVWPEV